ncbi:hypothetical protein NDR87_29650 [Nocardia sp. CDC159]|uniref:Condensation domain-containing protein n=1 Tax=Nocardia pulmonis TaxID=2951408 RepID=A0A9X2J0B6_9NOCA|nr:MULTISPECIES: hypothetical protein [Nocardia]MCM6777654.1 hypothetical protein [Nocardia pulmonis]MCM6790542.1 hypothetical protein [Nocardia sp. CDC159]
MPADTTATGATVFALRFTGYLYTVGLRDAFADLMARHEALRTVDPTRVNLVLSPEAAPVPDLVPVLVTPLELPGAVNEFLSPEAARATSAPVRARSFRILGDPEDTPDHLLVIITNHHTTNRISPARLTRDLMTAYAARRRNLPPSWTHRPHHLHVHELRQVHLLDPTALTPAPV